MEVVERRTEGAESELWAALFGEKKGKGMEEKQKMFDRGGEK